MWLEEWCGVQCNVGCDMYVSLRSGKHVRFKGNKDLMCTVFIRCGMHMIVIIL